MAKSSEEMKMDLDRQAGLESDLSNILNVSNCIQVNSEGWKPENNYSTKLKHKVFPFFIFLHWTALTIDALCTIIFVRNDESCGHDVLCCITLASMLI